MVVTTDSLLVDCISCRYNLFKGCPSARTCTFILRGGAEQFMEETERSLHDAIMIVRRALRVSRYKFTSLDRRPPLPITAVYSIHQSLLLHVPSAVVE